MKKVQDLNIIMLSDHCCIRVIKEGLALLGAGANVHFLQRKFQNVEFRIHLPTCSFWDSKEDLQNKLQGFEGFDIIHCHNEPSWIGTAAKEARPDMPVIMDCHDLNSARFRTANDIELKMVITMDGFITPSKGYKQHLKDFYGSNKPALVLYSMVNEFLQYWKQPPCNVPSVAGIVYEGGLTANDEAPHSYRDYRPVVKKMVEMRIPFHIYGANNHWDSIYQNLGAYTYPLMPYHILLNSLRRYDWGFVGPGIPHPAFEWCMPNKLFEYLAAGIPVIVWESAEAAQFVEDRHIGWVVRDLDEIRDVMLALDPNVYTEHLPDLNMTMESQVPALVEFYNQFI